MTRKTVVRTVGFCALGLVASIAQAADNKAPGWYAKVNSNFALSSGNSKTSTFGLQADASRIFLRSDINLVAGAMRQDNTKLAFDAVGASANGPFTVRQTETKETSTDAFFARIKGRYRFTESLAGALGGDYERDIPGGIESRYIGIAGLDYLFSDRPDLKFSAGVGATVTQETQAVPKSAQSPNVSVVDSGGGSTAGARFNWKLEYLFGSKGSDGKNSTKFTSDLIVDQNLQDTDDLRMATVNAIDVAINQKFGLRVGINLKYDNQPPVLRLKPVTASGQALAVAEASQPLLELKKTDVVFLAGLTINVFSAR